MTLDELTTPLTPAQIEEHIYAAIAARGVSTTGWKDGAVVRTLITAIAIVLGGLSELQAAIARGGFLELATGPWLTLVARYVYGVERNSGTFARGEVTLDNTGGGVYAGDPGDLIVVNSAKGKSYRNTASFSVGAFETGVTIPIQAIEIGSESTASPGQINQMETVLLGVTVTNAAAVVGTDEETDVELRTRCRESTGALSPNGPRDAYAYIAKSATAADGSPLGVTRVRTVADGYGGVTAYVATATGAVSGGDVAIIQGEIERKAGPLAITPTVVSATAVPITVAYELWVLDSSGLSTSQIEEDVASALISLAASTPIGGDIIGASPGRLHLQAIEAAISKAVDGYLVDLVTSVPAGDVTLAIDEVPVLGGGSITATIHEVPRAS